MAQGIWFVSHLKRVRFSHVRVFSDSRNLQKRATKSDTSGHCLAAQSIIHPKTVVNASHRTRVPVLRCPLLSGTEPSYILSSIGDSSHRVRVLVSGPVFHPSENSSHRRVRVGGALPVHSPSKSSRHRIRFSCLSSIEPIIHRNTAAPPNHTSYHPPEKSSHRSRVWVRLGPRSPLPSHFFFKRWSSPHRVWFACPASVYDPQHFKLLKFRCHSYGSLERPRPEWPRQKVSSAQPISAIHPNPVVIKFCLSIIPWFGHWFTHCSLDPREGPPKGAPSKGLVYLYIRLYEQNLNLQLVGWPGHLLSELVGSLPK